MPNTLRKLLIFEYWPTERTFMKLWYAHIKSRNGKIIAPSQGYDGERDVLTYYRALVASGANISLKKKSGKIAVH